MDHRIGGKRVSHPTRVMGGSKKKSEGAVPTEKIEGAQSGALKTAKIEPERTDSAADRSTREPVDTLKIETEPTADGGAPESSDDGFRRVQGSGENVQATTSEDVKEPVPAFAEKKPVKTRLFPSRNPDAASAKESPAFMESAKADSSLSNETPVVGWLVIITGPGQGTSIEFSFGKNEIGRDKNQQIPLDYGDDNISREAHAYIEYDPREKKCYLIKGANLVYLNGSRIASGAESDLYMGDVIEIGSTQLVFMPFCGESFCWTDSM